MLRFDSRETLKDLQLETGKLTFFFQKVVRVRKVLGKL